MKQKSHIKGWLYVLPALIVLAVFTLYPIYKSVIMAFYTDYDFFNDVVHAYGFDNFLFLWEDELFHRSLRNTFIYVLGVVPTSIILSLSIAIALNTKINFKPLFRMIYFITFVTSVVAVSIVWRWIFHGDYGLMWTCQEKLDRG